MMTDRLSRVGLLTQDEINRIELLPELSLGMAQRRNFVVRVTSSGLARVRRMCYTEGVQGSHEDVFVCIQSVAVENVFRPLNKTGKQTQLRRFDSEV